MNTKTYKSQKKGVRNHFTLRALLCLMVAISIQLPSFAQTTKVKGTVKDQNSEPLVGAMVQVKGTSVGSISDVNGSYELNNVAANAVLTVTYIGFETIDVSVDGKSVIDITLKEMVNELDDVVVIGYGSVKKRDLTGSISTVDAKKISERNPISVFDAMQGIAAGVQVTSNSGAPGEDATILVRGTSTFGSGTSPLYVVDDVQMDDISSINPNDIASMEILKDASSAAIYGSRSANGVIIIQTKKGEKGKPRVDVKFNHTVGEIAHYMPLTTPDDYRFYNSQRRVWTPSGSNWKEVTDSLRGWANGDGNQYDYLLRIAHKNELSLGLSGSVDKMSYYLSAGYLNNKGIIANSNFNRFTTRINVNYNASERLTFGNNVQITYSDKDGVDEGQVLSNAYTWLPYYSILRVDGSIAPMVGGKYSTYAQAMGDKNETRGFNVNGLLFAEYKILPKLKFRANLSGNMRLSNRSFFRPQSLVSASGHSNGYQQNALNYDWMNEDFLSYDNSWGEHNFTAMAGMSFQSWTIDNIKLYGTDFSNDIIWTLNNATSYPTDGNNYSKREEHSMASFFGRATYNWKSRYLFAANVRADGSSRFSKSRRWGIFPSASAGWRVSDESFMDWTKPFLTDAKFRASWGITGNEAIGNYASWPVYKSSGYYNGVGGLSPNLTYADLGWEETAQYDFGIDLSMLKGRITANFDYYIKNTTNLLYNVNVPKETGYSNMTMNVGSINNKGWEFSVNASLIQTRDWSWDFGFNISHNKSVITKLADGAPFYTGSQSCVYVQEGHMLGEFYVVKHDGIFAYDESNAFDSDWKQLTPVFNNGVFDHYTLDGNVYSGTVYQKKQGSTVLKAGDVNWLDSPDDKDGVIDWTKDKVLGGCAQPDVYGGFNSTLAWKGLSLNVYFNYSLGGQIFNSMLYSRNGYGTGKCAPTGEWIHNAWIKPGDVALYPKLASDRSVNKCSCSDYWIEDGSFIRLQSARLAYKLPEKVVKKLTLSSASVYVYGNNLLTWTNYSGFDPEFGGGVLTPGVDTGKYPRTREGGIGLNIVF